MDKPDRLAIEKRIAHLKIEVEAMKAIVTKGLTDWVPGTAVAPEVNAAFRRVQEIGAQLHEADLALAALNGR